jgi:phospholipase/carboxylesterase
MLEAIEVQTGEHPRAAILVLHGLGADGNDFLPIVDALDLSSVGPVRFVLPHAPVRRVTVNNGAAMRAWFDIVAFGGRGPEDEAGMRASQREVEALIERERQRGIDASRIVLMGFSQGCAVSLLTGLRHPQRLAGIAGLSGFLPLAASTAAERSPANADLPVFLAHGSDDPIISLARGTASRDALVALGVPVEWHEYAMGHSVHPQEVDDLGHWLRRVLGQERRLP